MMRNMLELSLEYRTPFDLAGLLRFFATHALPGVELHDPAALRLRHTLPGGWVEARFAPEGRQVVVRAALSQDADRLATLVTRWLDLDADPLAIDARLAALPGGSGKRLPGCLDGFELAVRSVLGQRVTVAVGCVLAGRLVQRFGDPVDTPWPQLSRTFPAPGALAEAAPDRIGELGVLRVQTRAIQQLAREWDDIAQHTRTPEALAARLVVTAGIGPWTAQYVTMRMLGWADAFPPGDVAVLRAMGLGKDPRSRREALARAEAWRPWRSYAVLRLWDCHPRSAVAPAPDPDA
jgi:AraC family transcriptional regulator of adaptative response / DNA-3-methyladenine glycosylase II